MREMQLGCGNCKSLGCWILRECGWILRGGHRYDQQLETLVEEASRQTQDGTGTPGKPVFKQIKTRKDQKEKHV